MIDVAGSLEDQRVGQRRETKHGPMAKTLSDLARYREIMWLARPGILVETGSWTGASAHWFAWAMMRAGVVDPLVITIDTTPIPDLEAGRGYRVHAITGDSADPIVWDQVEELIYADDTSALRVGRSTSPRMVVLDSDHAASHVEKELELAKTVPSVGQYLVVEDTLTSWMPNCGGYDGSPAHALEGWPHLEHGAVPHYRLDLDLEDMLARTQHPGGWLRRVS